MSSGRGPVAMARVITDATYKELGGFEPAWRYVAQDAGIPDERIRGVVVRRIGGGSYEVIIELTPRPRWEGLPLDEPTLIP